MLTLEYNLEYFASVDESKVTIAKIFLIFEENKKLGYTKIITYTLQFV